MVVEELYTLALLFTQQPKVLATLTAEMPSLVLACRIDALAAQPVVPVNAAGHQIVPICPQ